MHNKKPYPTLHIAWGKEVAYSENYSASAKSNQPATDGVKLGYKIDTPLIFMFSNKINHAMGKNIGSPPTWLTNWPISEFLVRKQNWDGNFSFVKISMYIYTTPILLAHYSIPVYLPWRRDQPANQKILILQILFLK